MKKAQAGLSILLGVIVSIFLIGLLVMVYMLMSSSLIDTDSLYSSESSSKVETLTTVENTNGENLSVITLRDVVCTLTSVRNLSNGVLILSPNYTQTNCHLKSTELYFNNSNWNVSYSYTFLAPGEAIATINDTAVSLGGVTTWFPIIIVITAMIVLILLTVIIITAIRGSGLMGGGEGKNKGPGNIGTA